MNASVNPSDLVAAMRDLQQAWQELRPHWRDAKAQDFQRAFLEPLPPAMHTAKASLEDLDAALRKMIRECE